MATPFERQMIFKVGGTISCIGSGYIIQDVLRNPDKRSKSVYHRIMVGLSTMDVFLSLATFILGSWPMPKESYLWAVGNMSTCDVTAFIGSQGYVGSQLYNCSLATYYLLQLKYNWQDHRMKRNQKWFHIVPCLIALLYCTIALCTKMIGPSRGYCGIIIDDYPMGCSNEPDSEVKCIRSLGMIGKINTMIIFFLPFICLLYVSITMFRVYKTVRDIEVNVIKYSFMAKHREQDKKKTMKRSRRIMIQGVLYGIAMILTWGFTFIAIVIILISNEYNPVIGFFSITLNPLQGAFNFLIYMIPVFRKMLKTHRLQKKPLENEALNEDESRENNGTTLFPYKGNNKSIRFEEKQKEKQEIESLSPVFSLEINENSQDEASSSGKPLFPPTTNRKSALFAEEEEEEKQEIESLPPVFSSLYKSEYGQDEASYIYET